MHTFRSAAEGVTGAVVRFTDELLRATAALGWLLAGPGGRVVPVPEGDPRRAWRARSRRSAPRRERPADERNAAACSTTCSSVMLLWVERWYDAVPHRAPRAR